MRPHGVGSNWNPLPREMADNEEDVADNWEDADTEELERRMEERQKQLEVEKEKLGKNKISKQIVSTSGEPQTQLPLKIQDSERTEYVAPIKILKRQSDSTTSAEPASNATTSLTGKQHKSLAERELEYASARARILGSPYSPDEGPVSSSQRKVIVSKPAEGSSPQNVKRQPRGPSDCPGFKQ